MSRGSSGFVPLLDGVKTVLLDCDGVLWRGGSAILGAADTVQSLLRSKRRVFFVTNNSTKSRRTYVAKVKAMLGVDVTEDQIVSSASATASFLASRGVDGKCYVVGGEGLHEELRGVGLETMGLEDGGVVWEEARLGDVGAGDGEVGAVVVGLDTKLGYYKMARAAHFARNPKVVFLATNPDQTFPASGGMLLPGAGSCVAAIEAAAQRKVDAVLGKPFSTMLRSIPDFDPHTSLMVGDRVDTDIAFGKAAGMKTVLVLTGVTRKDQVEEKIREMTTLSTSKTDTPDPLPASSPPSSSAPSFTPDLVLDSFAGIVLAEEGGGE